MKRLAFLFPLLLLFCVPTPAATPTYVTSHLCAPLVSGTVINCPYPGATGTGTLAGNALTLFCTTNNTNPTITWSDGGDTFSPGVTGSGNQQVQWQFVLNGIGGKTSFTATFSATTTSDQCGIIEWANILTAAALDGTSSGTGTAASAACSASVGAAGDLVLQMAVEDSGVAMTSWTHGSGFTAVFEDGAQNTTIIGGLAVQFQIAAGAVTPAITQSPGTNHFDTVCMALKPSAGNQGTIPTGVRIVRIHDVQISGAAATPFKAQFPCTGNLIVLATVSIPAVVPGTTSDTNLNTWSTAAAAGLNGGSGNARIDFSAGPTCGADMTISMTFTGTNQSGDSFELFDIAGANASPIDTGITCGTSTHVTNACQASNTDSTTTLHTITTVTLVPSTATGLNFSLIGVSNPGPTQGASVGIFTPGWSATEASSGDMWENNGVLVEFNTSTSSRTYGYTFPATAGGAGAWVAQAAHFLAAAGGGGAAPQIFVIRP